MNKIITIYLLFFISIGYSQKKKSNDSILNNDFITEDSLSTIEYYKTLEPNITNLSLLGKAFEASGYYNKAISTFEKVLTMKDDMDNIRFQLAGLYIKKFQYDNAKINLDTLIQKNSKNASYFYQRGVVAQKEKDSSYINYFKRAFLINSNHIPSIQKLATYYILNKPKDSALFFIDRGLSLNNTNIVLINLKAQYYFHKKKYGDAIKLFEKLLMYGENDDYIYEKLAIANNKLDQINEALKYYLILLEKNKKSPIIHYEIGVLYQDKEVKDSAIFYLEKALDLKKVSNLNEYFRLSQLYTEKKDYQKAIFYLKLMLNEQPDYYMGYYQIAFLADQYYADPKLKLQYYESFKKVVPPEFQMEKYLEYADKRISELKMEIHFNN